MGIFLLAPGRAATWREVLLLFNVSENSHLGSRREKDFRIKTEG